MTGGTRTHHDWKTRVGACGTSHPVMMSAHNAAFFEFLVPRHVLTRSGELHISNCPLAGGKIIFSADNSDLTGLATWLTT